MKIKKLKYNNVEDISLLKKFLEDNSSGTKKYDKVLKENEF